MSLLSLIFGSTIQKTDKVKVIDKNTFKKGIQNKNAQLIDVRTNIEFKKGSIKNAINLDFFKRTSFLKSCENLNKNKPVYVFCRSGSRSNKAAHLLVKQGFTEVYDLKGGYLIW